MQISTRRQHLRFSSLPIESAACQRWFTAAHPRTSVCACTVCQTLSSERDLQGAHSLIFVIIYQSRSASFPPSPSAFISSAECRFFLSKVTHATTDVSFHGCMRRMIDSVCRRRRFVRSLDETKLTCFNRYRELSKLNLSNLIRSNKTQRCLKQNSEEKRAENEKRVKEKTRKATGRERERAYITLY